MSKRTKRVISHALSGAAKRKKVAADTAFIETIPKIDKHFHVIEKNPVQNTSVSIAQITIYLYVYCDITT